MQHRHRSRGAGGLRRVAVADVGLAYHPLPQAPEHPALAELGVRCVRKAHQRCVWPQCSDRQVPRGASIDHDLLATLQCGIARSIQHAAMPPAVRQPCLELVAHHSPVGTEGRHGEVPRETVKHREIGAQHQRRARGEEHAATALLGSGPVREADHGFVGPQRRQHDIPGFPFKEVGAGADAQHRARGGDDVAVSSPSVERV
mmetsp:Transcript_6176/g.18598  ORF Transcript_6176/g.18598 Transcript_6176/m.18598 type:complete len:202 (+) Transcript_6176:30-635(+)